MFEHCMKEISYFLFNYQISDWTGATYQDRRYVTKYNSAIGAGGTQYSYYYEEDESSFQLVDTSRSLRPMYGRGRFVRGRGNFRGGFNNQTRQGWSTQNNMKNSGQLQVLSKAQKNKERYVHFHRKLKFLFRIKQMTNITN